MKSKNQDFAKIARLIRKTAQIIITSHHNPDGDAVGSAMALYHTLVNINPDIQVVLPNSFPDFLSWISGSSAIRIFENEDQALINGLIENAGLLICVDFNTPSRTGKLEAALKKNHGMKILIDHHPDPDNDYFEYCLSDTSASSTAELVYHFLDKLGLSDHINQSAAESLYAGIITDTGSFSFSCNNPKTYRIMARLMEKGVDAERLHRLIYDNFSEDRLRLLGFAFNEKLMVFEEFKTAIISFTDAELSRFKSKPGDTEGIVNYPLSIKDVVISIMISQRGDHLRLSFRSKGDFAVNSIAKEYFEGGGHRNAAGGNSYLTMDETIQKIKDILPLYQNEINNVKIY
jgi:bifunctional oligoribonuclease and PAP phosphatase NrnA